MEFEPMEFADYFVFCAFAEVPAKVRVYGGVGFCEFCGETDHERAAA